MAGDSEILIIPAQLPVLAANGGLFVSRGIGTHPQRVIDSFELIYVKSGALSIEEEGNEFVVVQDETLILWPGRRHAGTRPYPPDLQFYWAHFTLAGPGAEAETSGIGAGLGLSVPQHVRISRPEQMTILFRRLLNEQEQSGVQPIPDSLRLTLMLWEITHSRPASADANSAAAVLAARADAYIRTQFHEPISAATIAARLKCNPDYLGRVFRKLYGRTITDAIHGKRVRHATTLLAEGKLSIDRVARECGFEDSGYFRRLFGRIEGMTPKAYRKMHVRVHVNTQ